jgi:signal transduction histidine kinase
MGIGQMKFQTGIEKLSSRLFWRLLSVPIFFKILGIGALVAFVFGSATLMETRDNVQRTLYRELAHESRTMAELISMKVERPLSTGDLFSVKQILDRSRQTVEDIRYIIVLSADGEVVAHTFDSHVPQDILDVSSSSSALSREVDVLESLEGRIFHTSYPILQGFRGTLHLGVLDSSAARGLKALTKSILLTIAFCSVIGAALALLLTHFLTYPINRLSQAARRIGEGDFESRSEVYSDDEIGQLAETFNKTAESLLAYRTAIEEEEKARRSLVEKVVNAQEEERKSISLELHDQIGQSLLALLLTIETNCDSSSMPNSVCHEMKLRIRGIIEEVKQLARGMHPPILTDSGLDSALANYADSISNHFGVKIDYHYHSLSEGVRLPNHIKATLYRVAQEGILNAVNHADSSRVSVVIIQQRGDVTLVVEDNGKGFDPDVAREKGGLGLTSMKERVVLLGGTCTVESGLGKGTTVQVRIPLGRSNA